MKKLKEGFRRLFLIVAVISLCFASCKQPQGESKTEKVTVTVKKGEHITKVTPDSFNLDKGTKLGFTQLKDKVSLEFEATYELARITLNDANGTAITNAKPYTFNENTTIFISSRKEGAPIVLKKLTIGNNSKEGSEIAEEMIFTVSPTKETVEVEVETDPEGESVVFEPPLKKGKLTLTGDVTTLTIKVGVASKMTTYTVLVKKLIAGGNFIDAFAVYGSKIRGNDSDVEKSETDKVLNGEENVVLNLAGPKATILAASREKRWTSFKINGVKYEPFTYKDLTSIAFGRIALPAKGQTIDIKIEIADETEVGELNFKIKRTEDTVDVPINKFYIRENDVLSDDVRGALHDESQKPEFYGAEPSHIEIESNENAIKSFTIEDATYNNVVQKIGANNTPVWTLAGKVTGVAPTGKDVTMIINPIDTETYHPITWTFHLVYKVAGKMRVKYEINGKDELKLPSDFTEGVKNGTNPSIALNAKFLNVKLTCGGKIKTIKINDKTINGEELVHIASDYILTHSLPITQTEKDIEIKITPADLGVYNPVDLKFKAKGDGSVEKIKPTFEEISGDKDLPKATFLEKLEGNDKPLYQVIGETADVVIDLNDYVHDFLCKEVKINGEKIEIEVIKDIFETHYKVKKSFAVNKTTPIDVKVEFIANGELSENLTWQFKLQGGGSAPSLPQSKVRIFRINGIGNFYNPLPKELTDHLNDGVNPEYVFDGKNATVEVGSYDASLIEKVVFKIDDVQKEEVTPVQDGYAYSAKYEFEINDQVAHNIELIIKPKNEQYSDLIYKFRLKWSGKKFPLPLMFGVDGRQQKNGYTATLPNESARLSVQASENIMHTVEIGEEGSEETCTINKFKDAENEDAWSASRVVSLLDNTGNATEKTFVIKVTPKDASKYEITICKYTLKGTKISEDNAEFEWTVGSHARPKLYDTVEWKEGLNSRYKDDYGSKAVTLEAHTVSPRAKVKYRIVDMEDQPIQGKEEKEMTKTNGVHRSEKIDLFADKPTRIKAWVVAEDGHTTNDEKGLWKFTYNPAPLAWEYENKGDEGKGAEYKTKAYDVIELEKDKVNKTDKKIYLVFVAWNEDQKYTVVNDGLPQEQTAFVKIGAVNADQEYYKTTVDVSKLLDGQAQELKATLKMKRDGIDCLTYNVTIKVKQP